MSDRDWQTVLILCDVQRGAIGILTALERIKQQFAAADQSRAATIVEA